MCKWEKEDISRRNYYDLWSGRPLGDEDDATLVFTVFIYKILSFSSRSDRTGLFVRRGWCFRVVVVVKVE